MDKRKRSSSPATDIHIRIPERDADLPDMIRRAAAQKNTSTSDWVRQVLRKEVTRQEAKYNRPPIGVGV